MIGHFFTAPHGPVAGGGLDLVPWAVCLEKFVYWSWSRPKLYIPVFDSFVATSLWYRVCRSANSECSFLFSRCSANAVARWAKGGDSVRESVMTELFGGLRLRRERLGWLREERESGGRPAERSWLGSLEGCSCGGLVFPVGVLATAVLILRTLHTRKFCGISSRNQSP